MPFKTPRCKITVLKRTVNRDLADEYLDLEDPKSFGPCESLKDGQEFVIERPFDLPENFCPWAWADIRHDILAVAIGGDRPWIKQRGVAIGGCTDRFRPVVFKVGGLDS